MNDSDEYFMSLALEEAKKAFDTLNFPCGAVVVEGQDVIGRAANRVYLDHSATHHAEINAIEDALAFKKRNGEAVSVLRRATLYTTVEPCLMCSGAIQQVGIKRVVFAVSMDARGDFSALRKLSQNGYRIGCDVTQGVLFEQSMQLVENWLHLRQKVFTLRKQGYGVDDIKRLTGLASIHMEAWGIKDKGNPQ